MATKKSSGRITVLAAAKILGYHQSRVKDLCRDGTLEAEKKKIGSTWAWMIKRDSAEKLLLSMGHKGVHGDPVAKNAVLRAVKRLKDRATFNRLVTELDRSPTTIKQAIKDLRADGHNLQLDTAGADEILVLSNDLTPRRGDPLIIHPRKHWDNKWYSFGLIGDNHFGSKHARLDVVNTLYDVYASEGISHVYNTGNMIEGESRFNKHDIKIFGLDNQIDFWIENYPKRKGIKTYFVTGDDHEGWYQKQFAMDIGRYMEQRAKAAGRDDLVHLGYVEADVVFKAQHGERMMKVMHPGGGSAYALSYAAQKLVESFQGGEKPSILAYGHYHKFDVCYPREVHCIGTGTTQDQSIFMRKQKIQAHVGGVMVRMNQAPDGAITRLSVEWMPFYDRGYYENPRKF